MKSPNVGMSEKDATPRRWDGRIVVWMVASYAALVAFYLLIFRLQVRPINDVVCTFNKHALNPVIMFLDRRHWYAAVLHHRGRRSGKEYATPVTAEPTDGGFVIPLSYGEDVDWLKNVRAAGRCILEVRDGTYAVGEPEVIDRAEALSSVSPRARLMFRVGRGHPDAGAARRTQEVLPASRGAHVLRCRSHTLDEPQGGIPFRRKGVSG